MAVFVNQATLTYSGGTVNSNIATGEIVEVLTASKTAVTETYAQGSEITYAINIINTANTAISGVSVTDNLGTYTTGGAEVQPLDYVAGSVKVFADGILQTGINVTTDPTLIVDGISIPANGVATVLYTARANSFAPPTAGGTITNTAAVSSGTTELTLEETITAEEQPNLSILKSVSPVTVNENGTLTYTFEIQNTGNTDAVDTDNIVITDTFNPRLSNLTVTYNGEPWSEPENYTYNEQTGVFQTVAGGITVPAATFAQDPVTGEWTVTPGTAVLTVSGTI